MNTVGRGYTHVYTGDGKGKTTASLGLAFRAAGNGLRVLIIQFLKGPEMTGERRSAEKFPLNLQIRPCGRNGVLTRHDISDDDRDMALETLKEAVLEITSRAWELVILDEVITSCVLGLLTVQQLVEVMDAKPDGVELVLTGRGAPLEVIEKADLVTEMREIKHYFRQGVTAREGIEK
jgi:cob(I)alamin adenosyltransferase